MIARLDRLEGIAVAIVAKIAPWLAPIPTAFLVYAKTTEHIGWPDSIGILAALPIEALGLVTAYIAVDLYGYNRSKRKTAPAAPLWIALALVAAYLAAAELLTLGLHVAPMLQTGTRPTLADWSLAVFPILSLVAMAAIAVRIDHAQRLADNASAAQERSKQYKDAKERRKAAQAEPQPAPDPAPVMPYWCEPCEEGFPTPQHYAAHVLWKHRNGHEKVKEIA